MWCLVNKIGWVYWDMSLEKNLLPKTTITSPSYSNYKHLAQFQSHLQILAYQGICNPLAVAAHWIGINI